MMKKNLNKKTAGLVLTAASLILGLHVGKAFAYFTSCTTAEGGARLTLGQTVLTPEEDFSNWTKAVSVGNTGDYPCYVRVMAVAGALYQDGLTYSDENGRWSPGGDGYYYYGTVLMPGEKTEILRIRIPEPAQDAKDFNVIVVQECAPVLYDGDGNPYADWEMAAVSEPEEIEEREDDGR